MSDGSAGGLRLVAIVLRSRDAAALSAFYRDAFDFIDGGSRDDTQRLVLGDTHLWIEPIDRNAAPPTIDVFDVPGWDPRFQHFALRVADMDAAMARLAAIEGWRPITIGGPQRLPANTGGVTAFKFRDPEGHPLELLMGPDRRDGPLFAEIDHTAISVVDVDRSIAFYERLGLSVSGRSLNQGIEQERLDAIAGATVDVVALRTPAGSVPHVELLGYRGISARPIAAGVEAEAVSATRMAFASRADGLDRRGRTSEVLLDPDGHRVALLDG